MSLSDFLARLTHQCESELQVIPWKMLCYSKYMDGLREDDITWARQTPPAEKLLQALDLMATGIELQRANLRRRHPGESDAESEARLQRWLDRVDD